jgi:hypothetical protein
VAQTGANYTLLGPGLAIPGSSFLGMYLLWTAGAPTGPVTAQFNFYFRVRLDSDTQTFDLFMQQLWTMGGPDATDSTGLMLVSSRTPAL